MADFIAVIRRAVDGLSDNTPEMRAKVYERARSAVVRQLENMKPRPPEAMFQRQIDKLDDAIREVEAEHQEALPPEEPQLDSEIQSVEQPVDAPIESAAVPEPDERTDLQSVSPDAGSSEETSPAANTDVPSFEAPDEAVDDQTTVPAAVQTPLADERPESAPEPEPQFEQADVPELQPVPEAMSEPVEDREETVVSEEPASHSEGWAGTEVPAAEPEPEEVYQPFDTMPAQPVIAAPDDEDDSRRDAQASVEPEFAASRNEPDTQETPLAPDADEQARLELEAVRPPVARGEDRPDNTAAADVSAAETTEQPPASNSRPSMPRISYDEDDVMAGFNDFVRTEMSRPVIPPPAARKSDARQDFAWDAPFDDLPEIERPASFEKALEAKQKEIAGKPAVEATRARPDTANARDELEELLGINRDGEPPGAARAIGDDEALPPEVARAVSKLEGKSFKVNKKDKRGRERLKPLPLVLAIAGVVIVAGGASALWMYRDSFSTMVSSLMPGEVSTTTPDVPDDGETPAGDTSDTAETSTSPDKMTEVAALDTDNGVRKFTQRLLPDGTETAAETDSIPVDQALPEGKTVAGQTEKSKDVEEAAANPVNPPADDQTQNAEVPPLAVTQKMFLYEERLGQTSPVAVPGTVIWKEKSDNDNGKPNPSIEAQIDVPDRQIKALMSIKRNTDASLPASHIIEIVFALPKDFEEGNVDSVQRIALKQTEQDRGNSLIAVPAKITDDFHMVALNDDADARKVNLDLLKNRGWIDIPVTYRNGRRALITLEKGATGTAVFNKVLAEWAAIGQTTAN